MEGNRKFWVALVAIVGVVAFAITVVIVQPPGFDLGTLMGTNGALVTVFYGVFKYANLQEHKIKAGGDKP